MRNYGGSSMPAKLEFKAKNVNKAVERASAALKVPKEELKYEVLSHGSSGIFGLSGTKKAKIRVKLPEDTLAAEETAGPAAHDGADTQAFEQSQAPADPGRYDAIADENQKDPQGVALPQEPVQMGRAVLERIVNAITADAEISVDSDEDRLIFNVNGGNAGILIGKRGQTLDAIQTIVNKVVNKHNQNRTRVMVDIEGYLATRKENLEKMALRLAEKSKKIGKPITLGPMNAYDRRIVHIALKDISNVQTRSRGEGPLRKLVIFPKRRN